MRKIVIFSIVLLLTPLLFSEAIGVKQRGIRVPARTPDGSTKEIRLYSGYHALIIGCSDYKDPLIPDLPNAVKDAREVAKALKEHGFQVEAVLDPKSHQMEDAFNRLIAVAGMDKDKAILVFFAGHGETLTQADGTKLGYILPVDTPHPEKDYLGFLSKAVSMKKIDEVSRLIRSKHVLMIFDSCFSGALFAAAREIPKYITEKTAKPVREYITAGTENETVPDVSIFKKLFLAGIKDRDADLNRDGYVTGLELGMFLSDKVVQYSNGGQHPQTGKINHPALDKGDFVFVAGGKAIVEQPLKPTAEKPSKGSLRVDTRPPGATVWLEGSRKGSAPIQVNDMKPGRIRVRAALEDYRMQEEMVHIRAGRETRLTLVLEPVVTRGNLAVRSEPSGARWYLEGAYAGTTPDEMKRLDEGRYKVEIRKEGYEEYTETVLVRAGETESVFGRLEPLPKTPQGRVEETWKDPVTGMEFVWVPGGCYEMGQTEEGKRQIIREAGRDTYDKYYADELPVHEVCVDGFWIGKYEVTNAQYRRFKSAHDSKAYKGNSLNSGEQPAVYVSWDDAREYAEWLNRQNGGRFEFRLPTEAEWEYACRGGTDTARSWGDDPDNACRYANVHDLTSKRVNKFDWENHNCEDGYAVTAPVGSFKPNGFGLYDMLGNVWEWCEDIYSNKAYSKHQRNNPIYTFGGSSRVIRGGGWSNLPRNVRCANRHYDRPGYTNLHLGFRLVRIE